MKRQNRGQYMSEINYLVNDFIEKAVNNEYGFKKYILSKNCMIWDEILDKELIEIELDKNIKLPDVILEINKYMKWLRDECMNEFIKYFHENKYIENGYINENDLRELKIKNIIITVVNNGNIFCEISILKNVFCINSIEIDGKTIDAVL
jgi:hypothetical protein